MSVLGIYFVTCYKTFYAYICVYLCALFVCNTAANVESLELEDGEEEDLVSRFAHLITPMYKLVLKY